MTAPRAFALDTSVLIFAVERNAADPDIAACRRLVFEPQRDATLASQAPKR